MSRYLTGILFVLAAASAAWGLVLATRGEPSTAVTVTNSEHDLGPINLARRTCEVVFRNPGPRPARLVGSSPGFIMNACIGHDAELPLGLSAGETLRFEVRVDPEEGGRFEATLILHLEDAAGFREVPVIVRGVCVAPGSKVPPNGPFSDR